MLIPLDLLARAKQRYPEDPSLGVCWGFVVRAIEAGWLDDEELTELLAHLRRQRDFGVEELLFAHLGDRLRVSFVDDHATCHPAAMITALTSILSPEDE
jgi:hypothetical protein